MIKHRKETKVQSTVIFVEINVKKNQWCKAPKNKNG